MVVRPHRRVLVKSRLANLVRTAQRHGLAGTSLGAAVAYRPGVGYVLLGGEHRHAALSAPGVKTEYMVLRSWNDLVAWMAVDASDPLGLRFDPIAAVSFYEKAVAALKPDRSAKPLEDVAEFTGWHRGVLEGVRWANATLANEYEDPRVREFLQGRLDHVERGGDGSHTLREQVAKFRQKLADETREPESAAAQRKALGSIAQLVGMVGALADLGPVNAEIPTAEREAYARQLGSLGAQLAKIKKNLRGDS